MGLAKYAAFEVISARIAQRGESTDGIRRWAHRHDFTYEPKPGYLYVRSRAISSRTNDNFDTFPAAEIKKAYRTFVGKPVFVNHHNENHRRMRGVIVDAALHDDTNPDGTPDTWVEVLMEVDAVRFPKLTEAVIKGWIDRTSMGTDVAFSVCSFCGNKASTPLEYCQHIPRLKGKRIRRHTASGPQDVLVHEICIAEGEKVTLLRGDVPIEQVVPGDLALTRSGWRRVIAARQTGVEETVALEFTDGSSLRCTPDHLIATTAGWLPAAALPLASGDSAALSAVSVPALAGVHVGVLGGVGVPFGAVGLEAVSVVESMDSGVDHAQVLGTDARSAATGVVNLQSGDVVPEQPHDSPVNHALVVRTSVDPTVAVGAEGALPDQAAAFVDGPTPQAFEFVGVRSCRHSATVPVYDLEVEDAHEFVANGIVVHNCYGLGFFENSLLVEDPADPTAFAFGVDTRGLEAAGIQVAALLKEGTSDEARDWDFTPEERDLVDAVMSANAAFTAEAVEHQVHLSCGDTITYHAKREGSVQPGEDWECAKHGMQKVTDVSGWGATYKGIGLDTWGAKTALPIQPAPLPRVKKPKYPNAGDHPDFKVLPVSPQHVIDHWYKGTPEEHAQGMRWYEDAHHVANALTMGDSDLGGGILSAYSPQASWPVNLFNGMRTFHTGRALHKGEGQVMDMHSKAVDRMLHGEHWSHVLKAPKTYAFAHLISTGGKDPDTGATLPDVVIDRHAMSVAAGRRMVKGGDDERAMSNILGNPNTYEHVAQAYRDAAAEISKREGREIAPHQVQAATWLTRQRLNEDEIRASGDPNQVKLLRGRDTAQTNIYQRWKHDVRKNWPGMLDDNMHDAALHRLGYGETKAPPDVDTLRDEQCPICGDQDNFNGDQCEVCGYIAPPAEFQDPDLEQAKQMDLRKDTFEDDPTGPMLKCDTCGAQFPADEAPGNEDPEDEEDDEDAVDPDGQSAVVEETVVPGGSDPTDAAKPDPKVKRKKKVSVTLDRDRDATNPAVPNPAADPNSTFELPGQNDAVDDEQDDELDIAPEEGDTCPECGKGTLHLVAPGADEDDPEDDADDDPLAAGDPAGDETVDEKADPGAVPFKKKTSAIRRAANRRSEVGMSAENPARDQRNTLFAALASQQRRIEHQDAQIGVLRRGLAALAKVAGVEQHPVFAALVTADVNNPAQPIPDPPAEAPSETTQEAATPQGKDDPQNTGATPGVNEGVTPDATTTLDNSNVVLDAQPFTELQDPTKPVAGTEGPRPLSEVKTETDVRVGNPNNPEVAFPLEGPFAQRPTTGKRNEARLIAALRLARLRREAYGEEGDELSLGQEIADSDLTDDSIAIETAALARTIEASKKTRTEPVARNLVPRAASQVTRTVPSVAPASDEGPTQHTSSLGMDVALFE